MSSSNNRIPKAVIKLSNHPATFTNGDFVYDEESFKRTTLQQYKDEAILRVKQEEEKMLEELQQEKERAIQKGYEEGYEIARKEAQERIEQEIRELVIKANEIYEESNEYQKNLINNAEYLRNMYLQEKKEEIVDFILKIVEKIVHQKVELEEIKTEELLKETLKQINYDTKKIYIRLNPDTKEKLMANLPKNYDQRIEWLVDLNLEPADFLIETEREFIDATIQKELEELREYIRGVIND